MNKNNKNLMVLYEFQNYDTNILGVSLFVQHLYIWSSTDRSVSFYQNSSVWLDSISPYLGSKPGWLKRQTKAPNHLATRRY